LCEKVGLSGFASGADYSFAQSKPIWFTKITFRPTDSTLKFISGRDRRGTIFESGNEAATSGNDDEK
jgi:hypothetical protein